MSDIGKFVMGSEELVFDLDAELLDESTDINSMAVPMANRIGVFGVDGLPNQAKYILKGYWIVSPNWRAASHAYRLGDVVRVGTTAPEDYWQCTASVSPYTSSSGAITFTGEVGDTVTDGNVTWTRRGDSLFSCVRFYRDTWLKFLNGGIIKMYLSDDRFTFVQCTQKSLPNWNGIGTSLEWEVTLEAFDPRWFSDTLSFESITPATPAVIWEQDTAYTGNTVLVLPSGSGHTYTSSADGTSGDEDPVALAITGEVIYDPALAPRVATSTAYAVGARVRPPTDNTFEYVAILGGTTAATAPVYPTIVGETVVDGTVTWQAIQQVSPPEIRQDSTHYSVGDRYYRAGADADPEWYFIVETATDGNSDGFTKSDSTPPAGLTSPSPDDLITDGELEVRAKKRITWTESGTATEGSETVTIVNNGSAIAELQFEFTVDQTYLDITVDNVTTGQQFTVKGLADAAGILLIDCDEGTANIGTYNQKKLLDGEDGMYLAPGSNTINITYVEPGPTLIVIKWREKWW